MELDQRLVQTQDIGLMSGVMLRLSNTCEAFSREVESLKGLMAEKDKNIAELTAKCKRLIDEKNANVPAIELGQSGGNGIAVAPDQAS